MYDYVEKIGLLAVSNITPHNQISYSACFRTVSAVKGKIFRFRKGDKGKISIIKLDS